MNIGDILSKHETTPLIVKHKTKSYRYMTTFRKIAEDYIFIPLSDADIVKNIELHLKNKNCKGFYIKKFWLNDENFLKSYYRILRKYEAQLEVVAIDRNLFNVAVHIAKLAKEKYNPTTIAIAGAIGKTVTAQLLKSILGDAATVSALQGNSYQLAYEPLMLASDSVKYCICEIPPLQKGFSIEASEYIKPDLVIFTKVAPVSTDSPDDFSEFGNEISKILDFAPIGAQVFMFEENEPLESSAMTAQTEGHMHILNESEIKTTSLENGLQVEFSGCEFFTSIDEFYMPTSIVLASKAAQFLNIDHQQIQDGINNFKKIPWMLQEIKLANSNVAMFNTLHHSPFPLKFILEHFFAKYPNKKKILVNSQVLNLGSVMEACHKRMTEEIAKYDFSDVVFLGMSNYGTTFVRENKKTFLKRFDLKPQSFDRDALERLHLYLKGVMDENCAVLFTVHPSYKINDIFDEDAEMV